MNLDRELLLAALKAAELVVATDSKIEIFTKVWLLADKVLAFNAIGTVIHIPIELPPVGGIDGKMLVALLEKSAEDEVTLELDGNGTAKFAMGRLRTTLKPLDPTNHVRELSIAPIIKEDICAIENEVLFEHLELAGMLQVKPLKHDPAPAFSSITLKGQAGKLWLYTSDRATINRSMVNLSKAARNGYQLLDEFQQLVPLHFIRVLAKLPELFSGGELHIDTKVALATGQDGAVLYTKLADPKAFIDMQAAVDRWWPKGKMDSKLAVPLPEELAQVLARAEPFATNKDGLVTLRTDGKQLTVMTNNPQGNFIEELEFEYPVHTVHLPHKRLKAALKYVNKIYFTSNGVALFGPKRFSHFIAGNTLSSGYKTPEIDSEDSEPPF